MRLLQPEPAFDVERQYPCTTTPVQFDHPGSPHLNRAIPIGKGFALFWAALFAVEVLGRVTAPGFDSALWWVDYRGWPAPLAYGILGVVAWVAGAFAVRPIPTRARFVGSITLVAVLAAAMMLDGLRFVSLVRVGQIRSDFPVPMSWVSAATWVVILVTMVAERAALRGHPPEPAPARRLPLLVASALFLAIVFPVAQMLCFGLTDYTRPADVAVVLGARAYANGALSNALEHRVHTACDLYRRGIVKKLLFSGGPGDGPIHETAAMQSEAVRLGVPPADILLDAGGVNTRATARNTIPMIRALGATRVLAVSHFYHLPRVKMTFQAAGLEVATVPALQTRPLRQMPWLMLRETGGLWLYHVRAVLLFP